jgi:hypothetical protein
MEINFFSTFHTLTKQCKITIPSPIFWKEQKKNSNSSGCNVLTTKLSYGNALLILDAYALFIYFLKKCSKKLRKKYSHVYLHKSMWARTITWKTYFFMGCVKQKQKLHKKAYLASIFIFLHRLQKRTFFLETTSWACKMWRSTCKFFDF